MSHCKPLGGPSMMLGNPFEIEPVALPPPATALAHGWVFWHGVCQTHELFKHDASLELDHAWFTLISCVLCCCSSLMA